MKKSILLYCVPFILVILVSLFFSKAYDEIVHYYDLSNRHNAVHNCYINLARQINNAAVLNPELTREITKSNEINLFFADSTSVIQQLDLLTSVVKDSINIEITRKLNLAVRSELSWLIYSNVPDSVLHRQAPEHIAAFQIIQSLLEDGTKRTNYLIEIRRAELDFTIDKLRKWMIEFLVISGLLLIITTISYYRQKSKTAHKQIELEKSEKLFRHTLESMLEGAQILDSNWKYIYVNNALAKNSKYTREELIGYSMMEKYPGIEDTELFKVLNQCMTERTTHHIETEFVFPDGSKADYDMSIQPVPEGIFILSFDITIQKRAREKIVKANRIYAFLSAINQSIVHLNDQETLLTIVCNIATEIGQFKLAWIGLLDDGGLLQMVHVAGDKTTTQEIQKHSGMDFNRPELQETPTGRVMNTGKYALSNDVQNDPAMILWKEEFVKNDIKANISLPLKKAGKVIGVFGLNSTIQHFFDNEEITLLIEAAIDISFALENFEKREQHDRSESELKLSEIRFRDFFESATEGFVVIELMSLTFVKFNANALKLLKYPAEELHGKRIVDISPTLQPDGRFSEDLANALIMDVLKGEATVVEWQILDAEGNEIPCELRLVSLSNFVGPQILASFVDITERKAAEEKLKKSLREISDYKYALDESSIVAITDQKGVIKYTNDNFCRISKFRREELIGQDHRIISSGYHTKEFIRNLWTTISQGKSWKGELKNKAKDGSFYWVDTTIIPFLDKNGKPIQYIAIRSDITERKKGETLIEFNKNNLTALINNTTDLMWSVDKDFNLITSNIPFDEYCKLNFGKAIKQGENVLLSSYTSDELGHFKKLYERAFTGEVFTETEYYNKPHEYWTEISYYPICKGNEIIGTACHSRDITSMKKAEKRILASESFNRGVLRSLSSQIAVIDSKGEIVAVNESWSRFTMENNDTALQHSGQGGNYFEVCENSAKAGDLTAYEALTGMKSVMEGEIPLFYLEYPCHSPQAEQWFGMRVVKFDGEEPMIVVAHEDITNMKKAKQDLANSLLELEQRVIDRTKEVVEKNKDITDSINYAKRIQVGLLPRPSQLTEIFPKSFILSLPRDILSGDFFWCHQSRGKKFIVVADCTGQGVPGALMSIIGNNLLEQIIVDEHIENPSEILELLDKRLTVAVKGDTQEVKDGMDMTLCVIDTLYNELYYAGAYQPLFVSDANGMIHMIGASRYSIGAGIQPGSKKFETKRFPILPGQSIYLSSDGFYSQFGGQNDKKFMKSGFKKILEGIQAFPIEEQKNILHKFLIEWSGKNEQVDDVLVVGIEL